MHKQISHIRIAAFLGPLLFVFLLVSQTSQQASGAFTISYSNVVENQTLSGVYKVIVVASDTSQVSNIKLYIDDVFLMKENSSPYEFSIATTNYADGNRVLKAVATDKSGNTNAAQVIVSVLFDNIADTDPPASGTIIMQDTTKSSGWGIYSTRPVMAEYVSSSSVLVGKNIDSITVNLKKSSSSATGTAQIGIINSNLSIKKLFATLSLSTLTTASTPYEFKLPVGQTYLIQAGDRIGVKYTGGTSSNNYLAIMRDTATSGPFDGTKTHLTYYTTSWAMSGSTLNHDLTMTLKYSGTAGDTTPPTITAPAAIITEATGQLTLVSLGSATASDLVDSTPVVTNDAPSGGFPVGVTTVTWTATDDSGNSNTATQSITISDTTAPTLTAPAAITTEATGALTAVSLGSPTVSDTADPSLSVTNDAPSGGFPVGTTTVTWTATDDSGNSVTASQTVTITDTTPPTVTASPGGGNYNSAQLVTLASNEAGTTIYYTLDGTSPTTSSLEYSSAISISTNTTVTFFGVDAASNFGSVVAETYAIDTTAPTVTAFPQGGTYGSTQSVTLTSDEDGTIIYYTTNGVEPTDSSAVYSSPIELSTSIVLKFFGKDASGNSAGVQSETYSISLPDTTPPIVVASPSGGVFDPSGVSVTLAADEQAVVIYYTTNGSDPIETSDQYSDTPILITNTTTLKFFGKDMSGNSGSIVTETYTIDSTAPPTATTKIMRPIWLPFASIQGQLDAYEPVLQDYDWPRLRMQHGSNSVPADDLAAFMSLKGHKVLSVTTLEKVKTQTAWAKSQGFASVEYNIEGSFDAGDTDAQILEAASVVHAAGLKFSASPTKAILADSWETIADVADMVQIQAQTLQDSPSEFDAFVEDWVHKLKARNPNIMVTVQTGTGQPTAPGMTLLETFQHVTDLVIVDPDAVDAVAVWFGSGEEGLIESYFKWYHEKYRT